MRATPQSVCVGVESDLQDFPAIVVYAPFSRLVGVDIHGSPSVFLYERLFSDLYS